jgi:hypothetical protein
MGLQRSSGNSPKLTMENDPFVFVYHLLLKPCHFHGKLRDLPSFATPQVPSFQGSALRFRSAVRIMMGLLMLAVLHS